MRSLIVAMTLGTLLGCSSAGTDPDQQFEWSSVHAHEVAGKNLIEVPAHGASKGLMLPTGGHTIAGSWPEADALFKRDSRWLGADSAYSVLLGGERVLWLFGDTFVAMSDARSRRDSVIVHNSIGLQHGRDPLAATMQMAWRERNGAPASFFPEVGDRFHWPAGAVRLPGGPLVVFLTVVHATPDQGLGFDIDGWRLALVEKSRRAARSVERHARRSTGPALGGLRGWRNARWRACRLLGDRRAAPRRACASASGHARDGNARRPRVVGRKPLGRGGARWRSGRCHRG